MHDDITNITVPYDIFYRFAEQYDVTVHDLANVYNKGVLDGLAERDEYLEMRRKQLDSLVGIPEKFRKEGERI